MPCLTTPSACRSDSADRANAAFPRTKSRRAENSAPPRAAAERIGILLINTGTPAAPEPRAVRAFLARFLADPRLAALWAERYPFFKGWEG